MLLEMVRVRPDWVTLITGVPVVRKSVRALAPEIVRSFDAVVESVKVMLPMVVAISTLTVWFAVMLGVNSAVRLKPVATMPPLQFAESFQLKGPAVVGSQVLSVPNSQ